MSGHTAIAFAVATVVTPLLPGRWRWCRSRWPGVVGFARIYYGAHLPLDVVGGAGIGILSGLVASLAFGTIDPVHREPLTVRPFPCPPPQPDAAGSPRGGPAGEGGRPGGERSPADVLRLLLGLVLLGAGLLAATVARNTVGGAEADIVEAYDRIPDHRRDLHRPRVRAGRRRSRCWPSSCCWSGGATGGRWPC